VKELLSYSLVSFSAVFFVMDPMGLLPIFVAMTSKDTAQKRREMARRATLVAFGLLTVFAVFGGVIFRAFGITLEAFRIAGGVLLLLMALDMVRALPSRTRSSPEETTEGYEKDDVAIVPLAMPLLAGPGAIATVMVVASRGGSWMHTGIVIGAVGFTCAVTYLMLRAAGPLNRLFGRTGIAVLERIMGLLLAAIAVQFIADGIAAMVAAGRAGAA
jgi:multiple antibiotic resistance protein